jgi:transcriptional regulator with XRE-family HTH domain
LYTSATEPSKQNGEAGKVVLQLEQEARMLKIMLERAMRDQGLSSHKVAEAIGVSHTTILRALRSDTVDLNTIFKIANFLNVRPSELLDSMATDTTLPDQLAVLLSHSRELENELKDAVERTQAGELDPAVIRDIVSYALYKLNQAGANNAAKLKSKSKSKSGAD